MLLSFPIVQNSEGLELGEHTVKLSTQALVMGRDFGNDNQGSSGSVSATVDFGWRPAERLELDGQFVQVNQIYQEGRADAAYWLSNDDETVLNGLSLKYDFSSEMDRSSVLKLGRILDHYDFFPSYKNARHKVQAFEGGVWKTDLAEGLSLDVGHIERYSSWSSREGGPSPVNGDFITLSKRLGRSGGDSGVQFLSSDYQAGKYSLTAYDYYAKDLYNNFGFKVSRVLSPDNAKGQWSARFRYDRQDGDSGGFLAGHEAEVIEATVGFKKDSYFWNAGWTHVGSSASYLAPFRTSHEIDMSFMWYTNQYEVGTDSFHWKGVYKKKGWVFYGLLIHADHVNRDESEANLVIRRVLENNVWFALFGGYGQRNFDDAVIEDGWGRDLRFYAGCSF
ncbi:hypothetical protein ACFFKJ_04000 [Pelagicoccus mobilis]